MSDLLAAVKARVAEDRAKHRGPHDTHGMDFCACHSDWPCDAARYLSVVEARLEWIERTLAYDLNRNAPSWVLREDAYVYRLAESELRETAKLLGVQG